MTDEAKRILEKFEQYKREHPPKSKGEIYRDELAKYIVNKLEPYNVPQPVMAEMLEHITAKTFVYTHEEVNRWFREWGKQQSRSIKRRDDRLNEERKGGV